jgi:hypothetical protein
MDAKTVIEQIDRALNLYAEHRGRSKYDSLSDLGQSVHAEIETVVAATIERVAPPDSHYRARLGTLLSGQIESLKALRRDYADGYLDTVQALVRADVFGNFLEMADHLLEQRYKDPAAVLIGGVLEDHLRELAKARGIEVVTDKGPRKADALNADLVKANAYNLTDQKHVTAWLDLRNNAAHANYDQYTIDQVVNMLTGVREFVARVAV